MDPVRFDEDLKVTIQQIGSGDTGLFERTDDVSSVAYCVSDGTARAVPRYIAGSANAAPR
jgi:hypothetical protein